MCFYLWRISFDANVLFFTYLYIYNTHLYYFAECVYMISSHYRRKETCIQTTKMTFAEERREKKRTAGNNKNKCSMRFSALAIIVFINKFSELWFHRASVHAEYYGDTMQLSKQYPNSSAANCHCSPTTNKTNAFILIVFCMEQSSPNRGPLSPLRISIRGLFKIVSIFLYFGSSKNRFKFPVLLCHGCAVAVAV